MDIYSCPSCHVPLKLALVPAELPLRLEFTPPVEAVQGPVDNVAAAAASTPEPEPRSPLADRPDIVAAKEHVVRQNQEVADLLRQHITETGGWFDPLSSPEIFERFHSWLTVKRGGVPDNQISKHRLSKVLVEILGATWHKTGKGRMYRLPDDLRPASRPAAEDHATVPVPAPASTPAPAAAPLTVVPADNVVQLRGGRVAGQDTGGRCGSWLLASGVPALQCELHESHQGDPDAAGHMAGGYWWNETGHGRLQEAGPAPFVDLPETTEAGGGEVSVDESGAYAASGERLPGDDEPVDPDRLCNSCVLPFGHGGPHGEPWSPGDDEPVDPDRLCNSCVLPFGHGGPHGEPWSPGDDEPGVGEVAAAIAEEEAAWAVERERLEARNSYAVGLESGLVAAAQPVVPGAVIAEEEAEVSVAQQLSDAGELHSMTELPAPAAPARVGGWYEGGVHYRVPLDPALVDAPFGRLEELFAAGLPEGYVLAPRGSVEVRELADGPYVTGPAVAVPAVPAEAPAPAAPETAVDEGGEVVPADARPFSVKLTAEQIGWPLRDIARVFDNHVGAQGLRRLGSLADIELRKMMGGPYATAVVTGEPAPAASPAAVEGPEAVSVSGEELQALVGEDAAAVALAAYRQASAGLSVPDHVVDPGDWA